MLTIVLVKITLLVIVAYLVAIGLRRASAGSRHLVWLATLLGLFLVPAAVLEWRPLRVPVLPATLHRAAPALPALENSIAPSATSGSSTSGSSTSGSAGSATSGSATSGSAGSATSGPSAISSAAPSPIPIYVAPATYLGALWALGVLVLVARLMHGLIAVRRIARTATEVDRGAWRVALHEVADRLDMEEPPRLVVSNAVRVPFACGFRTPTIVLPAEAMSWTDERRRIVLLHELAHIQRRDMFGHLLSRLACVMYWFHPLVWMAASHLRAESERACDDLAIRSGAKASDYAQHLLDIVTSIRGPVAPAVACTMARKRDFEGRMLAILDPERRRVAPSRFRAMALVGALSALYAVIAIAVLAPREVAASPQSTQQDVALAPVVATHTADRTISHDVTRSVTKSVTASVTQSMRSMRRERDLQSADSTVRRSTLLVGILRSDSSASLRKVAAWGLQQFQDESGVREALATALRKDGDPEVREMAAWSLEGADGQDAATALSGAMHDPDVKVRETATWALASNCSSSTVPAFVDALKDADPKVRASAAWGLGQCDLEHAPPELGMLLSDKESHVRKMATWALYQIKDPSSEPAIEKALQTETDDDTKRDMIRAIAAMGDRAPQVVEKLLDSKDPATRAMAVHALAGDHVFVWPMPQPRPRPNP
ncbi:MAG TPA: M56 family metallopeptidase [Gemmatimonadaceae bacterium]|nr:M56 family metallopeptidase [Gemmatimonadaceae bacterium]